MNRGRFYASVFPVAGILYALALVLSHGNATVAVVGAMLFAVIGVGGYALPGRARD